ncbi:MAG: hypothetical protein ACHQNT_05635 [Bacteroidia bacterium]
MKSTILLCALTSLLFSCSSNEQSRIDDDKRSLEEIKTNAINELTSKYHIKYLLDTLSYSDFKYSIDFKPIIASKFQLIDRFILKDIYEKDSCAYVSIEAGTLPTLHFDFQISNEQVRKFKQKEENIILVVSMSSVSKIKFPFIGEIDEEGSMTINLDFISFDFIAKGEIIDIVLIKKV